MKHDFLYKRGYLITNNLDLRFENKSTWKKIEFNNYNIFLDRSLNSIKTSLNGVEILIIGIVLDPFNYLINTSEITDRLAIQYRNSFGEFLNYLDTLSGRFLLLFSSEKETFILQDASGSRSCFYSWHDNYIYLSSHAEIISDINGFKFSNKAKQFMESTQFQTNKDRYFPGIASPYDEIKMLTPNTLLNISKNRVERFFPRGNLEKLSITDTLIEELAQFFNNQIELLNSKYKLSLSLTAGLDSRLSFASAKKVLDSVYFYTLTYNDNSQEDAKIAAEICEQFNVEHHTISTKSKIDGDFLNLYLKNTSNVSSAFRGNIAETLYYKYPENYLHIKSNGSEICRSYYRNKYSLLPKKASSKIYSKLYGIYPECDFVQKSFEEYLKVTHLNKRYTFNYDHYDLFYWENRIGNWQGLCLFEWDIAQDTFIPFNNRYILTKMLSIPLKDRLSGKLYYDLINKLCPKSLQIPINPFEKRSKLEWIKRLIRSIRIQLN